MRLVGGSDRTVGDQDGGGKIVTGPDRLRSSWGGAVVAPDGGLVGREVELGVLREFVDRVAAGRGGSVWVEGEPGIGKSALVEAGLAWGARVGL